MKNISKQTLEDLYVTQKLNPYEIGKLLSCEHKTIRSYLKLHGIPTRPASEYNFLPRKSHTSPTTEELLTVSSIAAHTAYLCEGWHTDKTGMLSFCNQDMNLINLFSACVIRTYKYTSPILFQIAFNFEDIQSKSKVENYKELLHGRKISYINDSTRKNPIIHVKLGGKNLAREFIANAYKILELSVKPDAVTNFATVA